MGQWGVLGCVQKWCGEKGVPEADWLQVEDGPLVGAQEQSSKEVMVRRGHVSEQQSWGSI